MFNIQKVGAYRKEMLKIDPLGYTLDTVDTVTFRKFCVLMHD
jgi:hypothetical protein